MDRIFVLLFGVFSFSIWAEEYKSVVVSAPWTPPYQWRDGDKIVGAPIEITDKILNELVIE